LVTPRVWPLRVSISCPVCASHTFTSPQNLPVFLSTAPPLPEVMRLPSALNATLVTALVCALRVSISCPVCPSHTFTAPSPPPPPLPPPPRPFPSPRARTPPLRPPWGPP